MPPSMNASSSFDTLNSIVNRALKVNPEIDSHRLCAHLIRVGVQCNVVEKGWILSVPRSSNSRIHRPLFSNDRFRVVAWSLPMYRYGSADETLIKDSRIMVVINEL